MSANPTILFASWHFYLDQSNGASVSTRTLLTELARREWQVKSLCASTQDLRRPKTLEELLTFHRCLPGKTLFQDGRQIAAFRDGRIESLVMIPEKQGGGLSSGDAQLFMRLLNDTLERFHPDVVMTYGGFNLGPRILALAKRSGAGTVVTLHNLCYNDRRYFYNADKVFVPSQFAANHYDPKLQLKTVVVPPLVRSANEPSGEGVNETERKYVLFFNPEPGKGVGYLIALAATLAQKRPDIPFLVVEGSADRKTLMRYAAETGKKLLNVSVVENTKNLDAVFRLARILIVPSLYQETFGRVVAEALQAGVPAIVSNRGALPEVVGEAGVILDIPVKYQPDSCRIPATEELAPWLENTLRLYDDFDYREALKRKGKERAAIWDYKKTADLYEKELLETIKAR